MSFPSITNNQEFFSDHYLESIIANDLKGLRSDWDARENGDEYTPRRGVRALRTPFDKLKQDAEAATVAGDLEPLQGLHDAILSALGFERERHTIEAARGEVVPVAVPVAHATTLPTGLRLVALEAVYAASSDEALGPDSRLIQPLMLDGNEITEATKAISLAFTVDDPPRHILLVAGATVVLCARDSWPEGRYLAVDLDLALGRNDTKAQGELDTVAALFSRDALVPAATGEAIIDELGASSLKQAVGVSADLREGVRRSVEDVANEIVTQRLAKNLRVYNEPDVARHLTRESLRFLYRILFLLYAEARPDLGIVPTLGEGYRDGYGLDRLRELALTELTTDHSINGTHLHDSLDILFELVNDGYHHEFVQQQFTESGDAIDDTGLIFEPLHSELFGPNATPLLDSIRLRNEVVQRILARLLLTQEKGGRDRRFVSYATLGINQLGAVYEGLMAYTGFLADEDLLEVRKPGSEEKHGTWVVPVVKADQYDDEVLVTEIGEDGISRRITHPKGSFVYRLSGRDRQRSASYYTPEVLTRCVVKHALAELLDQNGETTSADALLDLTICEPALGSGAFLNEAINQLSAEYLARKQNELEDTIDPEKYSSELQRVKTHFALHQSYGVDLNATAVELAEVSLWLNAMHPGLRAPWFGLHLRRGNSLVGARRAVYPAAQLVGKKWLKSVPEDRALMTDTLGPGEVHHFVVPADGWGAAKGAKEARDLRADAVQALKDWHKGVTSSLSKVDIARCAALARRVEALWELAAARLKLAERQLRRPLRLYPREDADEAGGLTTRAALEAALGDENTPLARLRLVMDAWSAMWFWPVEPPHQIAPPSRTEWLTTLEALLGLDPADRREAVPAQIDLFADLDALEAREAELASGVMISAVDQVRQEHRWLDVVREIASHEGFFHWELEFAPVFLDGGFDLQIGNPPWVRPEWNRDEALTELDPWLGFATGSRARAEHVDQVVTERASEFVADSGATTALQRCLNDVAMRPELQGIQTNLYMLFITDVLRRRASGGTCGLIHPVGHLTESRGGPFRARVYPMQRRLWHFINELRLFPEIGHARQFAIAIYGEARDLRYLQASKAFSVSTVDLSLEHDGRAELPTVKNADGSWSTAPHAARVIRVDRDEINTWAGVVGRPDAPPIETPSLWPFLSGEQKLLRPFAATEVQRIGALNLLWSEGMRQDDALDERLVEVADGSTSGLSRVVFQGPAFDVATPIAAVPPLEGASAHNYKEIEPEDVDPKAIPRSIYAMRATGAPPVGIDARWRVLWRRRVDIESDRPLRPILIPPGAGHFDLTNALAAEDEATTVLIGAWLSGLPIDYSVKVTGKGDLRQRAIQRIPVAANGRHAEALIQRFLRLNCVVEGYAAIWNLVVVDGKIQQDDWTSTDPRLGLLSRRARWESDTPLRSAFARRQALIEIDALVALCLGWSADDLALAFRAQFHLLRSNEALARHDQNGREVPKDTWAPYEQDSEGVDLGRYVPPFTKPDREADMRHAYAVFDERYGAPTL